ncbi:MAG: YfhO family protein [Candidatus Omnitrophota bacterium]
MKIFSSSERRDFVLYILFPFALWVLCFWDYLSAKMILVQDSISYYEHIGFFTENLKRGVLPLWHPDWVEGAAPYNFFLRRIGEVNPVFWFIVFLKSIGIKQIYAHFIFLSLYFFMGTIAFWLTARMLFRDKVLSVTAYLLLLFSSWGGQLFFTYIVILFTPILWFFYFLLAFGHEGKKHQFLGVCLCTGILATTYIPFFFLTIAGVFSIMFSIFYYRETVAFFKRIWLFFKTSRAFFVAGIAFLIMACIPAVNFYNESKQGEFILPGRHAGAAESSTLSVSQKLASSGDLITQGYFENIFDNQSTIAVESFFITFFVVMLILLSVINPITRRGVFLLATVFVLMLLSVTESTPVYKFVYDHVFFFRFMRNIYYLFWLGTLPMAILFCVEQLRVFIQEHRGKNNRKTLFLIILVHVIFSGWLISRENILWTTWVTLAASLVFFVTVIKADAGHKLALCCLFIALLVQPAHVLHTMSANGNLYKGGLLEYGKSYFSKFAFQRNGNDVASNEPVKAVFLQEMQKGIYYASRWYADVLTYVPDHQLKGFMHNRLYLADNTVILDDTSVLFFRRMGGAWQSRKNLVFLAPDKVSSGDVRNSSKAAPDMEAVTEKSTLIRVEGFDVNTLKIKSNLPASRFLVWTDSYDSNWHVYINGKEGKVLRVFHAFKGVWIPEGRNSVLFRYASPLRYMANYLLMVVFILMAGMVMFYSMREGLLKGNNDRHESA